MGYSIGRDVSVVVTLPDGTNLSLGKVISFDAKQSTSMTTIKGIDGVIDNLRFFEGWTGSIKTERRDPTLDAYFAGLESNYYAGLSEQYCQIQQTISEPDGSISQYRYERVLLEYAEAGAFEADKSVSQTLNFKAARRIKQA
jgi:hypothetical protein